MTATRDLPSLEVKTLPKRWVWLVFHVWSDLEDHEDLLEIFSAEWKAREFGLEEAAKKDRVGRHSKEAPEWRGDNERYIKLSDGSKIWLYKQEVK